MCTLPGNNKSPCPPLARHTQISLKTDSNNNCNTSSYDDSSSVKANSNNSIQDKDFILELLCWHNEYRQVFNSPLPSDDDVNNDRPTPFSSRARHAVTALTVSSEVSTCRPLIYCCAMWTDIRSMWWYINPFNLFQRSNTALRVRTELGKPLGTEQRVLL